jgi:MYXO-CTERM domain-containing protein
LSTDGTIDSSDRELLQDVSPFIPVEGTDTSPVVVTIPGDVQAGTYWVGIRITSPNVQTETAVSGGISVLVPRDDDDGSCGGGPDGGSLWAFLPLALLAAICLAVRRRKMALER